MNTKFYPWYVVFVLMLAQTFSFIDRMIMGLLVGPIRETFGISDTQFSLLAGLAFSIFYAIMGLPMARIADSRSRRALIAFGITLWSLMTAMCGLAKGYWTLFLARVGVGVGEATLSPAAYSLITDYFSRKTLAIAFSVYTLGVTFGSGLAYMIGGKVVALVESLGTVTLPLIGVLHGWQLTFMVVGIPGLLVALLMMTVREPERKGRLEGEGKGGVPLSVLFAFIKTNRIAIGTHVLGVSLYIIAVFGINIWGPTYLIRTFDFSRGEAGLSFGLIMMILGTLGLLVGGMLADKWYAAGRRDAYSRVIMLSAACMTPAVVLLAFADELYLGIIGLSVATFFSAFQGGIAGGVLQLMTPNQLRSQVTAIYFLCANLIGLGLGPTVVAVATDYVFQDDAAIGKSLALTASIICPLAMMIIWSGMSHVRKAIENGENQVF